MTDDLVEQLEELGFTEYESKCLLALTRVDIATAKQVSDIADIPRSRVYDTAEALQRRRLIEISEADTRSYRAVPVEEMKLTIERSFDRRIETVTQELRRIENVETSETDDAGVWTVRGKENVLERAQSLVDESNEELLCVAAGVEFLNEACIDRLVDACNRGVEVVAVTDDDSMRAALKDRIPEARIVDPTSDSNSSGDSLPARAVMADRERVLVATKTDQYQSVEASMTGVWGRGRDNGFVVAIQQLLSWHLERFSRR